MKDYTGTVLHFNEMSYSDSIQAYSPVLKAINEAGNSYENLDTTFVFNDEVLKDMLRNRTESIRKQYAEVIEQQILTSKFTSKAIVSSMRENVSVEIQDLTTKVEAIFTAIYNVRGNSLYTIHFDIENIAIVDGEAVLTDEGKEKIKDKCETKIRTEAQNKLYNLSLQLKDDFAKIVTLLNENNPKLLTRNLIGNYGGLFYESEKELQINPNLLAAV